VNGDSGDDADLPLCRKRSVKCSDDETETDGSLCVVVRSLPR